MASSSASAAARLLVALRFLAEGDEDHHHENETTAVDVYDSHNDTAAEAAAAQSGETSTTSTQPWGDVILASLIIQTVTLSGLVVSIAMKNCCGMKNGQSSPFWTMVRNLVIPSFAGGALLATTLFLIFPEALHLVAGSHGEEEHEEEEHEEHTRFLQEEEHEEEQPWKVGTAMLGGFLLPILFWVLFPGNHHHGAGGELDCEQHQAQHAALQNEVEKNKDHGEHTTTEEHSMTAQDLKKTSDEDNEYNDDDCEYLDDGTKVYPPPITAAAAPKISTPEEKDEVAQQKIELSDAAAASATAAASRKPINYSLAASILVGDFFHNFTDGVFLGTAFSLCSRELGYALVLSTVYHELAQEIGDFFLLTYHCGLLEWEAVTLNFVAGFSVMIGALMVLALDMTDTSKGIVLSLGAGVYLHIAASECVPRAQSQCKTSKDALIFLLCFITGAVPIGLVMLNHGHCEPGGHEER